MAPTADEIAFLKFLFGGSGFSDSSQRGEPNYGPSQGGFRFEPMEWGMPMNPGKPSGGFSSNVPGPGEGNGGKDIYMEDLLTPPFDAGMGFQISPGGRSNDRMGRQRGPSLLQLWDWVKRGYSSGGYRGPRK